MLLASVLYCCNTRAHLENTSLCGKGGHVGVAATSSCQRPQRLHRLQHHSHFLRCKSSSACAVSNLDGCSSSDSQTRLWSPWRASPGVGAQLPWRTLLLASCPREWARSQAPTRTSAASGSLHARLPSSSRRTMRVFMLAPPSLSLSPAGCGAAPALQLFAFHCFTTTIWLLNGEMARAL